jgi:hypothetical protein
MNTEPHAHYADATRLLAVAESVGVDAGTQTVAALASIAHALLAAAPRRARRVQHEPPRRGGSTPRQQWVNGTTE